MAQDFRAAFGLGVDEKSIALTDMSGVALASIKALNKKVAEKDAEIAELKKQNQEFAAKMARIEAMLEKLNND